MDLYSKPYTNEYGYTGKLWYHLAIVVSFKKDMHEKRIGRWNIYYDGYFHFFSIYPFRLEWWKRALLVSAPSTEEIGKAIKEVTKEL